MKMLQNSLVSVCPNFHCAPLTGSTTLNSRWILHVCQNLIYIYMTVVAVVSIYDWILTVIYADSLNTMEENPVGRWLMGLKSEFVYRTAPPPHLTLFLVLKAIGTMVVLSVMYLLYIHYHRVGHPVAIGVCVAQLTLSYYLTS